MDSLEEELRELARRRVEIVQEGVMVAAAAAGLFALATPLGAAASEPLGFFVVVLGLFSWGAASFVQRLLALLEAPCPRCGQTFHAGSPLRRGCAHCGSAASGRRPAAPDSSPPAP